MPIRSITRRERRLAGTVKDTISASPSVSKPNRSKVRGSLRLPVLLQCFPPDCLPFLLVIRLGDGHRTCSTLERWPTRGRLPRVRIAARARWEIVPPDAQPDDQTLQ